VVNNNKKDVPSVLLTAAIVTKENLDENADQERILEEGGRVYRK